MKTFIIILSVIISLLLGSYIYWANSDFKADETIFKFL